MKFGKLTVTAVCSIKMHTSDMLYAHTLSTGRLRRWVKHKLYHGRSKVHVKTSLVVQQGLRQKTVILHVA